MAKSLIEKAVERAVLNAVGVMSRKGANKFSELLENKATEASRKSKVRLSKSAPEEETTEESEDSEDSDSADID